MVTQESMHIYIDSGAAYLALIRLGDLRLRLSPTYDLIPVWEITLVLLHCFNGNFILLGNFNGRVFLHCMHIF